MPGLSIIIINYNSKDLIIDFLSTFKQFNFLNEIEIIIIDNSNEDPSSLLNEHPSVRWFSMGYNAGFARANNKGIELSKGDAILLLNPDVLAIDDSISKCYQRLMQSSCIACGIQLLNPDSSNQISGSYFMKGGLNHLLPLPFLGNLFKWLALQLNVKKTSIVEAKEMVEVDWVNGAFLMVKKEVLNKSGLLDEDFFLYAEEIEWCSRLRKHGKICLYGDLHMIHLQGETANQTFGSEGKGYYNLFDRKGRQLMLSNFVRIRKQFGSIWFLIHLLIYTLGIPVFLIGITFQILLKKEKTYQFYQWSGFARNVICIWEHMVKIISNRPYFYKVI